MSPLVPKKRLSREEAAVVIQSHFRGRTVRQSLFLPKHINQIFEQSIDPQVIQVKERGPLAEHIAYEGN